MADMLNNPFLQRLSDGKVLIADGATGTNLQAAGLASGVSPEAWVFEHPEEVLKLHQAFVEAGADLILTNTFGGTRLRMKDSPYGGKIVELNQRAVDLAHQAARLRSGVLVGGSLGPTGMMFPPYGELDAQEARAGYAEQTQILTESGVDVLVLETHFAIEEALAAFEGARHVSSLPIVVSFSFDRGTRTMMGVKPAQVVQAFQSLGVVAIGANCGTTLENMEKVVTEYAASQPGLIIWAKPNAGLPVADPVTGRATYGVTPQQMGEAAVRNVRAGARIVGGCCGSTPAHVAAMAAAIAMAIGAAMRLPQRNEYIKD
jgi:5-methyltetrahydrofolate--homocysteine methyltransferase